MSKFDSERTHDERGAALMLVIAFMVLMGTISAAVLSTTTSGIQQRVALDQARNRQYAADAGIETTVAAARGLGGTCAPPPASPYTFESPPTKDPRGLQQHPRHRCRDRRHPEVAGRSRVRCLSRDWFGFRSRLHSLYDDHQRPSELPGHVAG